MPEDIEMRSMGRNDGRKGKYDPPEDTDYRPINWRRVFFTPKYIRGCSALYSAVLSNIYLAFHILAILIAVATALLTIYHDKAVHVSRPRSAVNICDLNEHY